MTPKQATQLAEIRAELKKGYDDYLKRTNEGTKSNEGHVSVLYPTIFDDGDYLSPEATGIEVYSYALGPSRNHSFRKGKPIKGSTTHYSADPFAAALIEVKRWVADQLVWQPD